jgi:regulator of RNase E activity RraA
MNEPLTPAELDLLRAVNTPTLANAVELLGFRDPTQGYTREPVRCLFPDRSPMVGYAVTIAVRSGAPPSAQAIPLRDYWEYLAHTMSPRVVVAQELDQPPAGAWWGEINANIHRALGCLGLVTDGTVRDLDEVRPLGFQFLAAGISVSHAHAHLEHFGHPVTIHGTTVTPGDLVHADKHGAIFIPIAHVRDVIRALESIEAYERPLIQLCKSREFSPEKLDALMKRTVL